MIILSIFVKWLQMMLQNGDLTIYRYKSHVNLRIYRIGLVTAKIAQVFWQVSGATTKCMVYKCISCIYTSMGLRCASSVGNGQLPTLSPGHIALSTGRCE